MPETCAGFTSLEGQIHVVLGAGQGIGRAAANALATAGASVVCVDVDATRAEQVAAETAGRPCVADATSRADLNRMARYIESEAGRLDGFVDVVGQALWKPLREFEAEDVRAQFALCFEHALVAIQELTPLMSNPGALTFVGSLAADSGAPGGGLYGAAKAALTSLVRTAAMELGPSGIRVNAVSPGYTRTVRSAPLSAEELDRRAQGVPLRRLGSVTDVASAILFLQSSLAGFVTGQVLRVDGGMSARPLYA